MKIRDWYWQGWQRGADGAIVYTGEYYTLPAGRPKTAALGLSGALIAVYCLTAFLPSEGGMWRIAAVPQLLELVPLVYLVIGAVCLARVRERMVYRNYHASWRRMRVSAAWSIGFSALMAAAELAYLFIGAELRLWTELSYLARTIVLCGLSVVLFRYMTTHPCPQSAEHQ